MKRYVRIILLFLIAVFSLALPTTTEARSVSSGMNCNTKDSKSYWLRHSCLDGFVVNIGNRVLAQADGLDQHDSRVEIMKETCFGSGLFGPVKTRLYSPSTQKYICFSAKGQVRTVNRKRVNKMGNLCAFFENPVQETDISISGKSGNARAYVNLQSAANPNWYLGFGPTRSTNGGHKGRALTPEGYEVLMPRRMSPKMTNQVRKDKCDFKFSTGRYTPDNMNHDWSGLYETVGRDRFESEAAKLRALERNSIEHDVNEDDQDEDVDDFDRKLLDRNRFPASSSPRTKVQEKISAASFEDDVSPLPSPLALRRRRVKKFRRKESPKKSPSYFYDHNRRRDESKASSTDSQLSMDSNKNPLFSSFL